MSCRWDREAEDYLVDGELCRHDDYSDPTYHCTARRTCSVHVGLGELTCVRCIGRTRAHVQWIVRLTALMPAEALSRPVGSEPANLAGPAGDPLVLSWRRIGRAGVTGGPTGDGIEETSPTEVLGIWQAMLSEDYGHELPDRITLATASDYLLRNLVRVAQDPQQDYPLMAREIRRCRGHLELVLRDGQRPDRGVPCPECTGEQASPPRLVREYAHWCADPDCDKVNYDTDEADRWVCPRNRMHRWTIDEYDRYLTERTSA